MTLSVIQGHPRSI